MGDRIVANARDPFSAIRVDRTRQFCSCCRWGKSSRGRSLIPGVLLRWTQSICDCGAILKRDGVLYCIYMLTLLSISYGGDLSIAAV